MDSIHGPRPGRTRDRRGRGPRGPLVLPGPLTPSGIPAHRVGRAQFDAVVARVLDQLSQWFERESIAVDVVIEEAPLLPDAWDEPVPASTVQVVDGGHQRVVVYRLPVVARSSDAAQIEEAVWAVLLHRLSEVWMVPPEDLDPR